MNLYVYKTVKCEVINVEFLSKDFHIVHWGINPRPSPQKHHPLFFDKPPSPHLTVQASHFSAIPPYIGFS